MAKAPELIKFKGALNADLRKFFAGDKKSKTIQRNYNFFLSIENIDGITVDPESITRGTNFIGPEQETELFVPKLFNKNQTEFFQAFEPMPKIERFHVRNVILPLYPMKREVFKYGPAPRSFPVFDSDGLEMRMELEEDENGTIRRFIQWAHERVMDRDGLFRNPGLNKIDRIVVNITDWQGKDVVIYRFPNVYLLAADPVSFDYLGNDAIRYVLTFGVDIVFTEFLRKGQIQLD